MKRADKADRIGEILDDLYPKPPIPLDHTDPYSLLVAVMLSAQTTDKKVNEVTPALFERACTPAAMAALEVDTIRALIREIGLAPTKAKNLKRLSAMLVERELSIRNFVPEDYREVVARFRPLRDGAPLGGLLARRRPKKTGCFSTDVTDAPIANIIQHRI